MVEVDKKVSAFRRSESRPQKLYLDGSAGMAGDMLLAALLDVGASLEFVLDGLNALRLAEDWELRTEVVRRAGIRSLRAIVTIDDRIADAAFHDEHVASHDLSVGHEVRLDDERPESTGAEGSSGHHASRHHGKKHGTPSRAYHDIRMLIDESALPGRVKERSLAVFAELAAAEATVHGVEAENVHFHEVGSTDAIIDVVGCCLALEDLNVGFVGCTPLHAGSGHVRAAHGMLPVPAPATLYLLRDVPFYQTSIRGELTTPTGAALVRALCSNVGPLPQVRIQRIGHGAGSKEFPFANVVRAMLASDDGSLLQRESVVEVSCNIDDMTPEQMGSLIDPLLAHGARDVWIDQVLMKKGRPAFVLRVLCMPAELSNVVDWIFRLTTTLGVRWSSMERLVLERRFVKTSVAGEEVVVKVGMMGEEVMNVAAEFEDALRVAERIGRSVPDVIREAERRVRDLLEEEGSA